MSCLFASNLVSMQASCRRHTLFPLTQGCKVHTDVRPLIGQDWQYRPLIGRDTVNNKFVVYSALSSYSSHIVVISPSLCHMRAALQTLGPQFTSVYFGQKVSHKGFAEFSLLNLKCCSMMKRAPHTSDMLNTSM